MGIKAKLILDSGEEFNILECHYSTRQDTYKSARPSGMPELNLVHIVLESRKDQPFFNWVTQFDETKQCEIHFLPRILGSTSTRKIYLIDAICVSYKVNFTGSGNNPMVDVIELSCGGLKTSDDNDAEYSAHWRKTFPSNQTTATVIEDEEEEEEQDLKFIAKLERLDSYNGEFGFDWMRSNYKTICENYDKLKKEYTPTKIQGEEYFVPWLSMFPNQDNVKLKLTITELEGAAKDTDIIKLPAKNGIAFKPEQLKVSEAKGKEITVTCTSPLKNNVAISLLDKNDDEVGKINIFKNANHEQLHFNITPVRILRSVSKDSDKNTIEGMIDRGFGDSKKDLSGDLKNLETYLNTQSLNQALLQCSIGKVYDVVIDEDKWIADDLIIDEGCAFKGVLLDKFRIEFEKQHPKAFKNRGITVFLSPLKNVDDDGSEGAGGYGNLGDIDSKDLAIFETNLWNKESFAHEIAHVAGLEHSFKEKDDLTEEEIVTYNMRKNEIDDFFDEIIKSGRYEKNEIGKLWKPYSNEMRVINSTLYTYNRNLYKFKKSKTDNIMDYYNNRKSFWKFQWVALQEDVIKFYGK